MAPNKNAQIRYKALDKCFANQYKKFYIHDLMEYCNNILSDYYAKVIIVSRRHIVEQGYPAAEDLINELKEKNE